MPTYDLAGRVITSRDSSGKVMQQVYDQANRRIRTVANYIAQGTPDPSPWLWDTDDQQWEDGSGNAINHGTDFDLNLISETNYNAAGQVIATRDARGTRTGFVYDDLGRHQQVVQAEGSPLTSKAYTAYDKGGRVARIVRNWQAAATTHNIDPLTWTWNATLQRWEDNGTPVKSVQHGVLNDQNLPMAYTVDKLGRVVGMTNPVGSTTGTVYYKDGRVKSTTDPLGYMTEHRYDGLRRLRRVVQAYLSNGVDPANWIWDATRWEDGSNNAINHTSTNDRNIIADVTLDVAGRQTAIRDPRGNQTTYAYDWLNRRTGLTDPLNNTWATAHTDLAAGQSRVVSTLPSPLSHQTEQNFDRLGRVIGVNYLDESPKLTPDVAFTYDISGNRTLMREFDGSTTIRRTEYSYDAARRLSQVGYDNDGNGTVDQAINYEYDRGGLRTQMTLPGNLTITYTYDQRGQLLSLTDWDTQQTRYAYDAAGRLVSMERPNEIRSVYTYDPASRLKQLRHARRDKVLGHFAYTVDARGNRTKAIETLPRPTTSPSAITSSNAAVDYYRGTWSTSGLFKQTTDPMAAMRLMFFGKQVTLTLGVGPDHGICDIYVDNTLWQSIDSYAAATGEDSTIVINLADEGPHLLDIRNRADKNLANTTVPATYKLRFKQLAFASGSRVYDLHLIEYAYDALARLSSAVVYAGVNPSATSNIWDTYHYDRAGNRTQQVEMFGSSTTFNYTYDAANRLTSISSPGYQYPTYDNAGRMTNDGTMSYTWDRAGRMLSAGTSSYAYNGLGQRISQTVGANVTQYLLDVQRGLYQVLTATTGAAVDRYVHGPTGVQAQKDSDNNWEWIVSDGLGSVRSLVDNAMNVLHWQHYMPYGVPWGMPNPTQTPFGFTGEPIDGNHLLHLRARYYHPYIGVFPSLDPLEGSPLQPMSLNRYAYVHGNPLNWVDPSGLIGELPNQFASCLALDCDCDGFFTPVWCIPFCLGKEAIEGAVDVGIVPTLPIGGCGWTDYDQLKQLVPPMQALAQIWNPPNSGITNDAFVAIMAAILHEEGELRRRNFDNLIIDTDHQLAGGLWQDLGNWGYLLGVWPDASMGIAHIRPEAAEQMFAYNVPFTDPANPGGPFINFEEQLSSEQKSRIDSLASRYDVTSNYHTPSYGESPISSVNSERQDFFRDDSVSLELLAINNFRGIVRARAAKIAPSVFNIAAWNSKGVQTLNEYNNGNSASTDGKIYGNLILGFMDSIVNGPCSLPGLSISKQDYLPVNRTDCIALNTENGTIYSSYCDHNRILGG